MSVTACLSSDNGGFHGPQKGGLNSFDVQFLVSHRQVNTQQILFAEIARIVLKRSPPQLSGEDIMSKGKNTNKEDKKKPTMTPKEKKAEKKAKKDKQKRSTGLLD